MAEVIIAAVAFLLGLAVGWWCPLPRRDGITQEQLDQLRELSSRTEAQTEKMKNAVEENTPPPPTGGT